MQHLPHIAVIRWAFAPPDRGSLIEIIGEQRELEGSSHSARIDRYTVVLPEDLDASQERRRQILMNWDQVRLFIHSLYPTMPVAELDAGIVQVWRDQQRFPDV